MSRISISSALIAVCFCGAVASAGVVGTFALLAPFVASERALSVPVSHAAIGSLPVRVSQTANGPLAPADGATVSFVQGGAVVLETATGPDGTTQAGGLQTGPYSVFISGAEGFAAFGSWLNPNAQTPGEPGSLIDVSLVPPRDIPVVEQILESVLQSASGPAAGGYGSPARRGAAGRELIQGYGFELDPDGIARGVVVHAAAPNEPKAPLAGLDVYFIYGGEIVSRSRTGADGYLEASGLKPGVHSFVVAGPGAFLALAAEVHAAAPGTAARVTELPLGDPRRTEEVALTNAAVSVASVSPVFPGDLQFLLGPGGLGGPGQGLIPPGLGGGGFGGGSGGGVGGGGGFGEGGLGALLGLAALGAAAAALADDDNNDQVVSPAVP
ncbi:MAG: hypothetical protein AB7U20_08660 [Planctomycetaceae bacterium]